MPARGLPRKHISAIERAADVRRRRTDCRALAAYHELKSAHRRSQEMSSTMANCRGSLPERDASGGISAIEQRGKLDCEGREAPP